MGKLKISILDVGHGDFIFVRTPFDENVVIDCGCGDVIPSVFLKDIRQIKELQITHPHTDHFDDIIAFSAGRTIESFRCPDLSIFSDEVIGWKSADAAKIRKLRETKRNIAQLNSITTGNGFSYDVWQPGGVDPNNPNSASLVTVLTYGSFKMLLGGDLPDSGWQTLVAVPDFVRLISGVCAYKVSHHGRQEGRSDALFAALPQYPALNIISDKPIDEQTRDSSARDWYSKRARGARVVGSAEPRYAMSTAGDGSIFIEVESNGDWWIYPGTTWRN